MLKVTFLVNIPSPYRVDFFNELGKFCKLTVLFESAASHARQWTPDKAETFRAVFLQGIRFRGRTFCPSVRGFLHREQADVFVVGGYATPTGILAVRTLRKRGIPFYLNSDGGMIKNDKKTVYRLKKNMISSAAYWLGTGRLTADYLAHYGAMRERIFIYPFTSVKAADIEKAPSTPEEKRQLREKLGIKEAKMILSVGQFIPRKGFDLLIKAHKNIEGEVGIYLVGGDDTAIYEEALRQTNRSKIHFLPFQPPSLLKEYYRAADLFVLPTREDIWGLVINEAMANGLPVITTDRCVAGAELLESGCNGFLVPVEDVEAIAEKSAYILSHNLCCAMGRVSLDKIRDYTIEEMAQTHLKIFEENLRPI